VLRRRKLRAVPDATARQWLIDHHAAVKRAIRRYPRHLHDDLTAIAQFAVIEACSTFDEARGAGLRGWVHRLIRWRLADEIGRLQGAGSQQTVSAEVVGQPADRETPQDRYDQAWYREAIGKLEPRYAVILDCRMRGYTLAEIAASLGLSVQSVFVAERKALDMLRACLAEPVH
jgi:RNA polymerase sigma factor (sigma-70 family)